MMNDFHGCKINFLVYLENWKSCVEKRKGNFGRAERNEMFLSHQTYGGILISVYSVIKSVNFLLQDGMNLFLRGYHAYIDVWRPIIGDDSLICVIEHVNLYDQYGCVIKNMTLKKLQMRKLSKIKGYDIVCIILMTSHLTNFGNSAKFPIHFYADRKYKILNFWRDFPVTFVTFGLQVGQSSLCIHMYLDNHHWVSSCI